MFFLKRIFCILFVAGIFLSCSSLKVNDATLAQVYVTDEDKVSLLQPSSIKQNVNAYQYFEGKFAKNEFASLLYLQADNTKIDILILNELGLEMGSISYDGKTTQMQTNLFPKQLKCEYIILDLQNVYADADELIAHYKKYNLDFKQTQSSSTITRQLSKNNELIEEITITPTLITIQNQLRKYEYRLRIDN